MTTFICDDCGKSAIVQRLTLKINIDEHSSYNLFDKHLCLSCLAPVLDRLKNIKIPIGE